MSTTEKPSVVHTQDLYNITLARGILIPHVMLTIDDHGDRMSIDLTRDEQFALLQALRTQMAAAKRRTT